jgi:hypothetical protein
MQGDKIMRQGDKIMASPVLNTVTGGASQNAQDLNQQGLEAISGVQLPTTEQLTLPELQKYAVAAGMTPAQMQAFLQQNNALNAPVGQTGTSAEQAALSQLANVSNAGAEGTPQEKAQVSQIMQDTGRNLAGQRGAIEQQAEARGVPPGLLQAALQQQNAGQDLQTANQGALQAQGQAYQQAVNAMAQGGALGGQLQGQQNAQANTVGQAQNAMQQFNAANQQNAGAQNAGFQQQANQYNTGMANTVGQANTGLANQRTLYNAQVPETQFNNAMQKAGAQAGQGNVAANTQTQQGQQSAGLLGGLLGTAGTVVGGMYGGPVGAAAGGAAGNYVGSNLGGGPNGPPAGTNTQQYQPMAYGGIPMKHGGMIPGHAQMPGNSPKNDTVPIMASPGEAVIPRTAVQQNPLQTMQLLRGGQPPIAQSGQNPQNGPQAAHHPADVATLLAAMKHLRGGQPHAV